MTASGPRRVVALVAGAVLLLSAAFAAGALTSEGETAEERRQAKPIEVSDPPASVPKLVMPDALPALREAPEESQSDPSSAAEGPSPPIEPEPEPQPQQEPGPEAEPQGPTPPPSQGGGGGEG